MKYFKAFFAAVWKMLKSNWLIKITALLFAIILWSYVLAETNPPRERVMRNIPVRYEHVEELRAKELVISGSLSDVLDSVDIRLEVKQSDLKYLSDENVRAYIDLSTINGKGEKTLKVTAQTTYGKVLQVSTTQVKVYVDDYVSRTVPVNVSVTGSVPAGYYATQPEITPDVVNVSGARVDVEKVASAECSINLDGLTEGYSKSVEVTLLDSGGEPLDQHMFAESLPSVIVNLEVLAKKMVEVDVKDAILGQDDIKPGYRITEVWAQPETVEIIGTSDVLGGISAIKLVPYSVSGASADIVALLDFQPIEGVTVLGEQKVQVFISIREITDTKVFEDVPVVIKNAAEDLAVDVDPANVDVTVIAGIPRLSTLDKQDIVPFIDVNGLTPGIYTLSVQLEVPEGFTLENLTPSIGTVTVKITQE